MKLFKFNKRKATLSAAGGLLYENSSPIVDSLMVAYPQLGVPLKIMHVSMGMRIAVKQEEVNQFVSFLMENRDTFTEELINSREFQEGFIKFVDDYFKMRSEERLEMARRVFLDFSKSTEKPLYPLERYDDTLAKLSLAGIRFIGFISEQIPFIQKEFIEGSPIYAHQSEETQKQRLSTEPLSTFIEMYLDKEVASFTDTLNGTEEEIKLWADEFRKTKREEISLLTSELEQLSVMTRFTRDNGWSGTTSHSTLTHYGKQFISVIKP